MITIIVAPVFALVSMQAGIDQPRKAFVACLKENSEKAEQNRVPVETYPAYISSACANEAVSLKDALVAFDVKNGIKKAEATSDAQDQIDDYFATSKENFEYRVGGGKPQP